MIKPRIVAALMSKGADLCHGWMVFDSTPAACFFNSLEMFKLRLLQMRMRGVWAGALGDDVT
jgi:hypothetical protein